MNSAIVDFGILWPALIAGLLVAATHVPLGIQVLNRGIVFIDLAIAQIAGLGGTNWTYTTVVADAGELLHTVPNRESAELRWVDENEAGRPWFNAQRKAERGHVIEEVGARLRSMMPFLDAK